MPCSFPESVHLVPQLCALLLHFPGGAGSSSQLVVAADGLVGVLLCLPEDGVGFFPGLAQNLFPAVFQAALPSVSRRSFRFSDLLLVAADLLLLLLDGDPAVLPGRRSRPRSFRLPGSDVLLGLLDDIVRQAQLGGDGKGVALSRDADEQPVGGAQGFHVKFAAGVFHPRGGEGKYLQLAVVGGGDGAAFLCRCRLERMAMARAAPSVGSVPAPSSSKSTRERSSACSQKDTMLVIWEEKVLRLCSMLCSSPISANTSWNRASSGVLRWQECEALPAPSG